MQAVVFDMDGVIFDSERLVLASWKQVAEKYGIEDVEQTCRKCLGTTRADSKRIFLESYGSDFPYDERKGEARALFRQWFQEGRLELKPGVRELLSYLKENGYRTALASSTNREAVLEELKSADVLKYFDQVICGDQVERGKPEPDIFLKACELINTAPENAYAIEDSYNGIRAASRAGMKPVMVPDLAPPTEEMRALSCCILPSLFSVLDYLKNSAGPEEKNGILSPAPVSMRVPLIICIMAIAVIGAELLLNAAGLELRTVAQMVKGTFLWFAAPVALLWWFYRFLLQEKNGSVGVLWKIVVGFLFLAICGASLFRGFFYVFIDEMVEERTLPDGMIRGICSSGLSESQTTYYEPVLGIFRKKFPGWTEEELTGKLTEKYGQVTFLKDLGQGQFLYEAEERRTGSEIFRFMAHNNYEVSTNFRNQLLKINAAGFWENRGRQIFFVDQDTGEEYLSDTDRADTSIYPAKEDTLAVSSYGEEDFATCAAALADWYVYALEDSRYLEEGGRIQGSNPLAVMHLQLGENQYLFNVTTFLNQYLEDQDWTALCLALQETIWDQHEYAQQVKMELEESAGSGQNAVPEETYDAQHYEEQFLENYQGDYEQETTLGNVAWRMVVTDAALGSRCYALLKSTDAGDRWQVVSLRPFGDDLGQAVSFTFLTEELGFATLAHNGGDEAILYVTENGGESYTPCIFQGISVTLDNGFTYEPYDFPEMPYEEAGRLYVRCGQGEDGDYHNKDGGMTALFRSEDGGHTFIPEEDKT